MVAGLRLVKGAVEYIKDNDAAVADLSPDSEAWQRAQTAAGETIYLAAGDGVTVTTEAPEEEWDGCRFKEMKIALDEVPEILRQLGIVPQNVEEETAYIYADSGEEEAVPFRGSSFSNASGGGLGALGLCLARSLVNLHVSFRSAYVEFEELETEN